MRKRRDPTAADYRRFDNLFWRPGGIYEDYRREGWQGSAAGFGIPRRHEFTAFGHRWGLHFGASLWSSVAEVGITLAPERRLKEAETRRIQQTGFYDDVIALFQAWGYRPGKVLPPGNLWFTRPICAPSEIVDAQRAFESLDLHREISWSRKRTRADRQDNFGEFLRWARRARSQGWRPGFVEFRAHSHERGADVRWKVRRDLLVGATYSCSWFFAHPPMGFQRRDWRRIEQTGFFRQATEELKNLGFEGYWRPDLFSDPDRLAAEFWKPTQDPRTTRIDFAALLRWRLPSGT